MTNPSPIPAVSKIPGAKSPAAAWDKLPEFLSPPPPLNWIESSDEIVYGTGFPDHIIGISATYPQTIYGMGEYAYGGGLSVNAVSENDTLTGGAGAQNNELFGDAYYISDIPVGGDNTLPGDAGAQDNQLVGDAFYTSDIPVGGDNTLIGDAGAQNNELVGDAYYISDIPVGGDNTLPGDANAQDDQLVGDANFPWVNRTHGADAFMFVGQFGNPSVSYFRSSDSNKLKIDIDNNVNWEDQISWASEGGDLVMTVDSPSSVGTITFVGMAAWTPLLSDFILI